MNSFKYIFFLFVFSVFYSSAQIKIDSLLNEIANTKDKSVQFVLLDSIHSKMKETDTILIPYLKGYMELVFELKEYNSGAKKILKLNNTLESSETLKYIDSLLLYKEYFKDSIIIGKLLLEKGNRYFHLANFNNSINYYNKSLPFFYKAKDSTNLANTHFYSGMAYAQTGDFLNGLLHYEKAIIFYEKLKNKQYAKYVNFELINLFAQMSYMKKLTESEKNY